MFAILGILALIVAVPVIGTIHLFTGGRVSGAILRGVANHYSKEAMDARELRDLRQAQRIAARRR